MTLYEKEYTITSYECDENNILRIRSLFNLFQDLADNHADNLGIGYHYCIQKNLGWIGSACELEIEELPKWTDVVILKTWPSKINTATALREFEMTDAKTGKIYVRASSQWVLLDLIKMRPLAILKNLEPIEIIDKRAVITEFEKLSKIENIHSRTDEIIRQDDIDLNHHVNNSVYPSWVLDCVDEAFLEAHEIKNMKIRYRLPAKKNDKISVQTEFKSDIESLHSITNGENKEFAEINVIWKKRGG